jgi:hypothetical protein
MKRIAGALIALPALVLTGCSGAPPQDEVADRFLIEYTHDADSRESFRELATAVAIDSIGGQCGSEAYESTFTRGDENLFYAWRVTCLMYFEDDLTPRQVEETKQMIADRAMEERG